MPKSKVVKQPNTNAIVVGEEGSWERVCELEEQLAHEQQSHDAEMIDAVSHYSALAVAELQDDIVDGAACDATPSPRCVSYSSALSTWRLQVGRRVAISLCMR
jgi:hypothetical protein